MPKSLRLILILATVFTISCFNTDTKLFGYSYNPTRKKLGIPELPKGWRLNKGITDKNIWFWYNPNESSSPFFERKTITVLNSKLTRDFNVFYGSRKYLVDEIYDRERLTVSYHFTKLELDSIACTFIFDSRTHYEPEIITKRQADSILNIWGLPIGGLH